VFKAVKVILIGGVTPSKGYQMTDNKTGYITVCSLLPYRASLTLKYLLECHYVFENTRVFMYKVDFVILAGGTISKLVGMNGKRKERVDSLCSFEFAWPSIRSVGVAIIENC
jgi:hypothetical protein